MSEHIVSYEAADAAQNGTALAHSGGNSGTSVEQIRQVGQRAALERRQLNEMYKLLDGCEWGGGNSVIKGSSFSPATKAAFAKFCVVTRANPQIHVDILGGKPYLNAQYYKDLLNSHERFIGADLINISAQMSAELRKSAKAAIAEAKEYGLPEPTQEVAELLQRARECDLKRANYGVPEWATHVYEIEILRYTDIAPLSEIAMGQIDGAQFVRTVRESNWAGGRPREKKKRSDNQEYTYDPDPVGNAEPAKTARSRTFRRGAVTAFAAWMENYDAEITRAESVLEAEWTEIKSDRVAARAALPSAGEAQAFATGRGEPTAARAEAAQPMPVRDLTQVHPAPRDVTPTTSVEDPELVDQRQRYLEGCLLGGLDAEQFAARVLQRTPATVEDYRELNRAVNEELDR